MSPPPEKKKKLSSAEHRLISATDANQQKKPLGSFVTFGNRRSLRVAMKTKSRRWVCNDIWMDIFPLFDRPQLGLKMALLSPRFNALVDKHFDSKSELAICKWITICKGTGPKAKMYVEMSSGNLKRRHLLDHSLPNKIRFNQLQIDYIDHSVIEFLHANQQIFDNGTNLELNVPYAYNAKKVQPIWIAFAREIWPIFATNIRHLSFSDGHHLDNLRRHTSPTILSDLNIVSIHSGYLLPDSITDDGPNATAGQALSKWLHIPRKDGQPKQLSCCVGTSRTSKFVNNFKEEFLRATISSAIYIIRIELFLFGSTPIEPFELMNERTNEMLTLEKEVDENEKGGEADEEEEEEEGHEYVDLVLKRCQIGKTATIQWEDKLTDNSNNVNFQIYEFGPLSPPKACKMNSKNRLEMNPGPSGRKSE